MKCASKKQVIDKLTFMKLQTKIC